LAHKWRLVSLNNKMVVGFTGVIAVATVLYTIVAGWQLYEIHSGAKDTHDLAVAAGKQADAAKAQSEQAKAQTEKMTESLSKTDELIRQATEQAKATNRLAQQAKRQADIAVNTLEAEERPWLGIDHIVMPTKVVIGSTVSNSLVVKNWGRGIAIHVLPEYQMNPICGPFPLRPIYSITTLPSPTSVMPSQIFETTSTTFNSPLTADVIATFKQPNCGLYTYARITYRDKGGHQHWRHICNRWIPSTDNTFVGCTTYNDGDEDYPDGKEP
jgi:hypothetical protein